MMCASKYGHTLSSSMVSFCQYGIDAVSFTMFTRCTTWTSRPASFSDLICPFSVYSNDG